MKITAKVEDGILYINDKDCSVFTNLADEAIEIIALDGGECIAAITYFLAFHCAIQDHHSECQHGHFLEASAAMLGDAYSKYRSILALQDLPANDQTQH
jgi:hypothetical protein